MKRLLGQLMRLRRKSRHDDAISELPSFSQLAKQKKYEAISETLQYETVDELCCWLDSVFQQSRTSALHVLIKHHPPPSVVGLLVRKLVELKRGYVPEAAVDGYGRTPLHIAVSGGCSVSIVRRLTESSELPALTMDNRGRFPLHCACFGLHQKRRNNDSSIHTIFLLLEMFPQAVIVKDNSGKTPLDWARTNKADRRIITALSTVQKLLWKSSNSSVGTTAATTFGTDVPLEVSRSICKSADSDDDMSSLESTSCPVCKYGCRVLL